jgi:DNA modification methylase
MSTSIKPNNIYTGDCRELLEATPDNFFSLSLWSPPYFVGKEYERDLSFEQWRTLLNEVISLHQRVLAPGGFLVINIADIKCFADESIPRFAANNISGKKHAVTREMVLEMKSKFPEANRRLLAEKLACSEQTVDRRLNGTNIRGGKYIPQTRVRLSGPDLEEFAYDAGLYLHDHRIWKKDASWANSRWTNSTFKGVDEWEDIYVFWKPGETLVDKSKMSKQEWSDWGNRSIWEIKSVRKNDDHPAKFPHELASRIIKVYSNEGDVVLDPFMGSGTSAIAAIENNRQYVGFELFDKYTELAQTKIKNYISQLTLNLELK